MNAPLLLHPYQLQQEPRAEEPRSRDCEHGRWNKVEQLSSKRSSSTSCRGLSWMCWQWGWPWSMSKQANMKVPMVAKVRYQVITSQSTQKPSELCDADDFFSS